MFLSTELLSLQFLAIANRIKAKSKIYLFRKHCPASGHPRIFTSYKTGQGMFSASLVFAPVILKLVAADVSNINPGREGDGKISVPGDQEKHTEKGELDKDGWAARGV